MKLQWRRMHRLEARECGRFARVIAVSEQDAEIFQSRYGIPSVAAVPTGVDVEYFQPGLEAEVTPKNMVFVGSMDWMPNDDGIRWFAESVLPLVQKQEPGATLTVVGRSPTQAMRRLAEGIPGIEVTGTVPDVRPFLRRAAISVVPLRVGGGTRLKIYEAMAAGTPMVSTTIGAEGLPVRHGEHLLIADSPEAQADAILSLLADRQRALDMADRARRYVAENCSWDAVAEKFLSACRKMEMAA
jgi:polysaccharide biosynthesis protein PslH